MPFPVIVAAFASASAAALRGAILAHKTVKAVQAAGVAAEVIATAEQARRGAVVTGLAIRVTAVVVGLDYFIPDSETPPEEIKLKDNFDLRYREDNEKVIKKSLSEAYVRTVIIPDQPPKTLGAKTSDKLVKAFATLDNPKTSTSLIAHNSVPTSSQWVIP